MKKERVNDEQALKLQTLGFNEECMFYLGIKQQIPIPLKQQVFRWFREKHKLFHGIDNNCSQLTSEWGFDYTTFDGNNDKWTSTEPQNGPVGETTYKTYEEAEEACIDKLIELCLYK